LFFCGEEGWRVISLLWYFELCSTQNNTYYINIKYLRTYARVSKNYREIHIGSWKSLNGVLGLRELGLGCVLELMGVLECVPTKPLGVHLIPKNNWVRAIVWARFIWRRFLSPLSMSLSIATKSLWYWYEHICKILGYHDKFIELSSLRR